MLRVEYDRAGGVVQIAWTVQRPGGKERQGTLTVSTPGEASVDTMLEPGEELWARVVSPPVGTVTMTPRFEAVGGGN
jgi:hypothetical protein